MTHKKVAVLNDEDVHVNLLLTDQSLLCEVIADPESIELTYKALSKFFHDMGLTDAKPAGVGVVGAEKTP